MNLPKLAKLKKGSPYIEILVAMAIVGILAAMVVGFVNPGKRPAQTRDGIRKNDIGQIAEALQFFRASEIGFNTGNFLPGEHRCSSSIGSSEDAGVNADCQDIPEANFTGEWDKVHNTTPENLLLYSGLITEHEILKDLPKDPINNLEYHYRYKPRPAQLTQSWCTYPKTFFQKCTEFWIGAKLESPTIEAEPNEVVIFRCTDMKDLGNPPGSHPIGCHELSVPTTNCVWTNRDSDCWTENIYL